jgi:hypothetical protein
MNPIDNAPPSLPEGVETLYQLFHWVGVISHFLTAEEEATLQPFFDKEGEEGEWDLYDDPTIHFKRIPNDTLGTMLQITANLKKADRLLIILQNPVPTELEQVWAEQHLVLLNLRPAQSKI